MYCFNIYILFIHAQTWDLYHFYIRLQAAVISLPAHPSPPFPPGSYLQVRGPLKGLVTDRTVVAAVLPVGLSAVPPQRVGGLTHLVAVVALVAVGGVQLGVLPSLVAVVGDLLTHKGPPVRANPSPFRRQGRNSTHAVSVIGRPGVGLGVVADQDDLLARARLS